MTDDDAPCTVALNASAPPSPDYVIELAGAIAQAVRILNHQTRHREALKYPHEADQLIREVSAAAARLPQLLRQIAAWLNTEYEEGRIWLSSGTDPEAAYAVLSVSSRLESASQYAGLLRQALDRAAAVTSDMAPPEGAGGDRDG